MPRISTRPLRELRPLSVYMDYPGEGAEYSELLFWHLHIHGTHPEGNTTEQSGPWLKKEFAGQVMDKKDPGKNLGNWTKPGGTPPQDDSIARRIQIALFGNKLRYKKWYEDLWNARNRHYETDWPLHPPVWEDDELLSDSIDPNVVDLDNSTSIEAKFEAVVADLGAMLDLRLAALERASLEAQAHYTSSLSDPQQRRIRLLEELLGSEHAEDRFHSLEELSRMGDLPDKIVLKFVEAAGSPDLEIRVVSLVGIRNNYRKNKQIDNAIFALAQDPDGDLRRGALSIIYLIGGSALGLLTQMAKSRNYIDGIHAIYAIFKLIHEVPQAIGAIIEIFQSDDIRKNTIAHELCKIRDLDLLRIYVLPILPKVIWHAAARASILYEAQTGKNIIELLAILGDEANNYTLEIVKEIPGASMEVARVFGSILPRVPQNFLPALIWAATQRDAVLARRAIEMLGDLAPLNDQDAKYCLTQILGYNSGQPTGYGVHEPAAIALCKITCDPHWVMPVIYQERSGSLVLFEITLLNRNGFDVRESSSLLKLCRRFESEVNFRTAYGEATTASPDDSELWLISVPMGSKLTVEVKGSDAAGAASAIIKRLCDYALAFPYYS
jgi:phosphotransferase system HPr-like phosphotransfer protein